MAAGTHADVEWKRASKPPSKRRSPADQAGPPGAMRVPLCGSAFITRGSGGLKIVVSLPSCTSVRSSRSEVPTGHALSVLSESALLCVLDLSRIAASESVSGRGILV